MGNFIQQIWDYLSQVLYATYSQLFLIFAPLLVLFLVLHLLSRWNSRLSLRFWGENFYLYGFGWFGCSIHELSHAFFALIFGHKISQVTLFQPNGDGSSLGHVTHSYNKKSIYQKIGNFFIGISPLLSGAVVLYLGTWLLYDLKVTQYSLFRIKPENFYNLTILMQSMSVIWRDLNGFLSALFLGSNSSWWKTALLIYILYSVGSGMTLSKSDLKSALGGFLWLIIFFFLFNLVTIWIGNFAFIFLSRLNQYLSGFWLLLIFFALANAIFIFILLILNGFKSIVGK